MKKYIRNYIEANGFIEGDFIPCEVCGKTAADIHHALPKGRGGKDDADNLIALCRECHNLAHENKLNKEIKSIQDLKKLK